MKRARWILFFVVLAILLAIGWLLWARPRDVDMAAYAPANSLMYLEINDPLAVVQAIVETDAWKLLNKTGVEFGSIGKSSWTRKLIRVIGIGPMQSVILSRAQVAIVVTNLGTVQEDTTLRVKPEVALIVETHTSETRIRGTIETAIMDLANATYDNPTLRRTLVNGVEFVEWRNKEGSRQIVSAIVGSLVVVGNSEAVVQLVLDSVGRRTASLKEDANLQRLRREFAGQESLTFGYVPQEKSAQLLSFAMPLILGRAPGDAGLQSVVSKGAAKLFGSLAWGSRSFRNGIEDRYVLSLRPSLHSQLAPVFSNVSPPHLRRQTPETLYSVTHYRFENAVLAWDVLKTSISSNVDALSAVVFSSLLKSALLSYGIHEPEEFLRSVEGEILTLRLDRDGEHTMLITGIKDREALRSLIAKSMKLQAGTREGVELFADAGGETGASFLKDVVILGTLADVRLYSENNLIDGSPDEEQMSRISFFTPLSDSSSILTYTDDSERVRRFLSTIMAATRTPAEELVDLEPAIAKLPYSATQTRIVGDGLERITRSPLGQFSSLLPLVIPDERRPQGSMTPPR